MSLAPYGLSSLLSQAGSLAARAGSFVAQAESLVGDLAGNYALILGNHRAIADIIPNVVVSEVHSDELLITDHPVESGSVISDHAFKRPVAVELRPCFSDSTAGFPGYSRQVYERLVALQLSRKPFDISTGKRYYTSMLVQRISVETDVTTENSLNCVVLCREVKLTSTQKTSSQSSGKSNSGASGNGPNGGTDKSQSVPFETGKEAGFGTQQLQNVTGAPDLSFDQYTSGLGGPALPSTVSTPGGGIGRA